LLRKVVECARNGRNELLLETSDFPTSEPVARSLPRAFSIGASIVARSMAALREGDFRILLQSSLIWSGAAYFTRFCSADPELEWHVRNHLREEEVSDPEAVFAEIVYLPEGRTANVLCRPVLRSCEIEYLGRSGIDVDRRLPVSDLLVTVTEDDHIVLYSRRLGRRVIPRLTIAHDFTIRRLAPVYQFLCHVQYGPRTNVPIFDWGPLEELPFLPRVRAGRVVFSGARWRITAEEVNEVANTDRSQSFFVLQELRHRRNLPRWVLFAQRDASLPVDLDNPLSVDAFVHILKRAGGATLLEMYPGPEELCVTGPEGRFQHELRVPFVTQPSTPDSERRASTERGRQIWVTRNSTVDPKMRTFPPGSEWLYVKLYGGPATLDEILTRELPALLRAAFSGGLISSWFFIRYADPHQHLRIRFHGVANQLIQGLLPLIASSFNPLAAAQRIYKIEFDTYEREIERYGGLEGMLVAEEIFFVDSEAALMILEALRASYDPDTRLRVAITSVDRLLIDCGLSLFDRRAIVQPGRESLQRILRTDVIARRRLRNRFRAERGALEALLSGSSAGSKSIGAAWKAFEFRSVRMAAAIGRLRSLEQTGRLGRGIHELAPSYVHMHVNRIVRSIHSADETILYDFLFRIYCGKLAREGKGGSAIRGIDQSSHTDLSEMDVGS
jgi:thiopeptide-type bacteriocin biosynthesis protein